ncbi:hypothetical protein [Polyangium spumosum]|uniref:Uncharacterized protein n=1 Tax=Polyangium spumosum TaxID=889282 RepID=A0A6N7PNZ0_9BACT|nr:hypothetical protein [Polyangium spumosum]MRG93758.1 hypothetical protein [Polyangium spumosum]
MSGFSLVQFMCEGGWGMYPVLAAGSAALGAAVRYALAPDRGKLAFTAALSVTTVIATITGVWTNVGAVMSFLEDPARASDAEITRTLFQGLKEAGRPGTLAGPLLTLVAIVVSVGVLRSARIGAKGGEGEKSAKGTESRSVMA